MINERIKKLRKALDLTQQEFAVKIGVKRNTVATYEMGRSSPSDSALTLICKTFNVNEEWLRNGTGEMYIPKATTALELLAVEHDLTNSEYLLIEKFLNLKPETRCSLIDYIKEVASAITSSEDDDIVSGYVRPTSQTHEEIVQEAEEFALKMKEQYILEKKREQQASSANGQDAV